MFFLKISGAGMLVEVRDLKKKSDGTPWRWIAKVAFDGFTSELSIPVEQFAPLQKQVGQPVKVSGTISEGFGGKLDFNATSIETASYMELAKAADAALKTA